VKDTIKQLLILLAIHFGVWVFDAVFWGIETDPIAVDAGQQYDNCQEQEKP
jgi:hypothetical protein